MVNSAITAISSAVPRQDRAVTGTTTSASHLATFATALDNAGAGMDTSGLPGVIQDIRDVPGYAVTTLPNSWGTVVTGGQYAPTASQLATIEQLGSLPPGISWWTASGGYQPGSIAPTIPVDLSAPSQDTATYLQQLFAIQSGQIPLNPGAWPSSAIVASERVREIAQLAASIVSSGPAYQADPYLTNAQVQAAAHYGGPFSGTNLNPAMAVALYNAANAAVGKPATAPISWGNTPTPSTAAATTTALTAAALTRSKVTGTAALQAARRKAPTGAQLAAIRARAVAAGHRPSHRQLLATYYRYA
jgi:hypothetical protein